MKKIISIIMMLSLMLLLTACAAYTLPSEENVQETIVTTVDNTPSVELECINVVDMTLADAMQLLQDTGFTNISSNATFEDKDANKWIVVSQNITAGQKVSSKDPFHLECKKQCSVYLDLQSDSNLFFDKYDIDVFFDSEKIATIKNGEYYTYLVEVLEGTHVIAVSKTEDSSVTTSEVINIDHDQTFKSVIKHSNDIKFSDKDIIDNIDGATIEIPILEEMILSDAKKVLKDLGFTNVRQEPDSDIWSDSNWTVITQSITAGDRIDKNAYIELTCIKTDDFYNNIFTGLTLADAIKLAKQKNVEISSFIGMDSDADIDSLSEEQKECWKITSAYRSLGESKKATLKLAYIGYQEEQSESVTSFNSDVTEDSTYVVVTEEDNRIPAPISELDCEGRHYSEILEIFQNAGFTNICENPFMLDYGYNPETRFEGCVITVVLGDEQFFDVGDMFEPNAEVFISYAVLPPETTTTTTTTTTTPNNDIFEYVLNNNTMKFHYPHCSSAKRIKSSNRSEYTGTRDELINMGYSPCGNCHP